MKKYLPLLALYLLEVVLFSSPTLVGDEGAYLNYAQHLSQGQSPPTMWWGPGYPLILSAFVILRLPLLVAKLANAVFLFGALVYLHRTLALYVQEKHAAFGT